MMKIDEKTIWKKGKKKVEQGMERRSGKVDEDDAENIEGKRI